MGWLADLRRRRLLKSIRQGSGLPDESAARLSILDDGQLAALARIATRASQHGKAWAFRVALPELAPQAERTKTLAAVPDAAFPRELDRLVALRANRALSAIEAQATAALPAGSALNREAALRTLIDLLRYGVKDDELGPSLLETIRRQPRNYAK